MATFGPEAYRARRKAEEEAGKEINHIGSEGGEGMSDWHTCSCGWKSAEYMDGAEYARQDWVKHILEHGAEITHPDGEKKIHHHRTIREEFNCFPDRLAMRIASLRYDDLAELLHELGEKLGADAQADSIRGRTHLSQHLSSLSRHIKDAAEETDKVWMICKPFMPAEIDQ